MPTCAGHVTEGLLKSSRRIKLGVGGWILEELSIYQPRNSRVWVPPRYSSPVLLQAVGDYVPLPYGGETSGQS